MFSGCRNEPEASGSDPGDGKSEISVTEAYPSYVKYRSFQNSDSTWGYTVFVNSRPYLHYSRIPYKNGGFENRQEAELVAGILVKRIQSGDMTPKLSSKLIDSIETIINTQQKKK